jgi:hypothetical protein
MAAANASRPNTSPHFNTGVRFTAGQTNNAGAAGAAFRNGMQQQQPQQRGGSFQEQYGYKGGMTRPSNGAAGARAPGMSAPKAVAFPANFNPNAAPSNAPLLPSPAAVSKFRTTFEAPLTDVPRARQQKKNKADIPLPDYLQQYASVPRGKLPSTLSSDERSLLRAERKRLRLHKEAMEHAMETSRKQREIIDLDAYSAQEAREKKGWNSQRIKVSFQLCSAERVAVDTMPRGEQRIAHLMASVGSAVFDRTLTASSSGRNSEGYGNKGLWTIPISAYDAVLARLVGMRNEHLEVVIVPVAAAHLRALRGDAPDSSKVKTKFESMRGIPPALAQALYPFQREGVEFCVNHDGRALIGDEMGSVSQPRSHTHCSREITSSSLIDSGGSCWLIARLCCFLCVCSDLARRSKPSP